ncbi:MAG: hypothetical protein PWP15_52 [Methanothermococcus sp.]|uniref:methyltransferase domain-containing protein n=1 Tax=Methanothermococcus sp. TaxID=2614238 RepID=UPI002585C52E|nr:methyltransferase domain-containing protein [Methanothermococcus sp.]MDK2789545.1 hypothetical protein [Methanothermococcus sp.]MDK2946440.1 hypothetical protein [Geotoga sp.]
MIKKLQYYFWATYRRKILDKLQEKYKHLYEGIVLDIGGRDRGYFKKPKNKVKKWIFADIVKEYNPDIVLDVSNMKNIENESIDVINAIELFEHVLEVEKGLDECYRVLKKKGFLIISVPFLYQIHADPYDFQRWTEDKWHIELEKRGFKIEKIEIMGRFFTVFGDMLKLLIKFLPFGIRHLSYVLFPIIDLIVLLDNYDVIKKHEKLGKYHGGYFIICKK